MDVELGLDGRREPSVLELARLGPPAPGGRHLAGPVRGVAPGAPIAVARHLPASGRPAAPEPGGDGRHAQAAHQPVGDEYALVHAQVPGARRLRLRHGCLRPLCARGPVAARAARPAVAPHLTSSLGDADGAGGLRVAHARERELDVVTPPGGQHLALPLVGDSCVFVSHRRPFRKSMVLQRPLESTRSRKMSAPPFFFTSEGTLRDSRKSLQFRLPVPAASCFLVQEIVGTFPVAVPG